MFAKWLLMNLRERFENNWEVKCWLNEGNFGCHAVPVQYHCTYDQCHIMLTDNSNMKVENLVLPDNSGNCFVLRERESVGKSLKPS